MAPTRRTLVGFIRESAYAYSKPIGCCASYPTNKGRRMTFPETQSHQLIEL
uniref:Uncharacterized protein n=1 Tax=Utricularia reniformis TaxID=192314 RepID=A0A1Y0B275_9LAMI|nr:hypothetical protein AEK19_MT1357 [Utricularia reniformis]ART31555.1 hypothetical protein AEK19_MT1357 [Utricularia reniformis]